MAYTVKLPIFEGPFDLLLHLIKVNEMDIQDIQIAEITKQYLDYIRLMQELDLELAGEFLVIAATLLHLKARTLLPVPPEPEEQEEEINEIMSAKDLVRQLVEYRKYKEAAAALRQREAQASRVVFRNNVINIVAEPSDELSADVTLLYKAFARVLRFVDSQTYSPKIDEQFTVEEKILYLEELTQRDEEVDLAELFKKCFNRMEVIVTFLATLELCRMKRVAIRQPNAFDKITIHATKGQLEYEPQ
jgi:segregation and condensation protein A